MIMQNFFFKKLFLPTLLSLTSALFAVLPETP